MVRTLLGLLALVNLGLVAAEIPSYMHVCGRRDPQINQCVIDSVMALVPKLKEGIPELDVPSIEPLEIGEVALIQLNNFQAVATTCKIHGLSNFRIDSCRFELEKGRYALDLTFPRVVLDADYNVTAKILVPINERGPIKTITENGRARAALKFDLVERRGQKYIYYTAMNLKIEIGDYRAVFRPNAKGVTDNPITQAINQILVSNRQDIIKSMTPNLEKAVSKRVIEIANNIAKHFTYDEVFPDRV